jgi:integrase
MDCIIRQKTRVLTPTEYITLKGQLKREYQLILDGLLFTGMRIEEFWHFCEHPEWYKPSRRCIDLPPSAILKAKVRQKERTVILSNWGVRTVEDIVKQHPKRMSRQGLNQLLFRAAAKAGMEMKGITPKMTRKTWISWLVVAYPHATMQISSSAGHDMNTLKDHYLGLAFPPSEIDQIKAYTSGMQLG